VLLEQGPGSVVVLTRAAGLLGCGARYRPFSLVSRRRPHEVPCLYQSAVILVGDLLCRTM